MFKRTLLAAAAMSLASTAIAADHWSGPYIGIGGGMVDTNFSLYGYTLSNSSGFGSLFGGYNADLGGALVLGIEAKASKLNEDVDVSVYDVKARAGVKVLDDAGLLFIDGGYSGLDIEGWGFDGWTVGVGYEHVITDNVHLRAEYSYVENDIYGYSLDSGMSSIAISYNF